MKSFSRYISKYFVSFSVLIFGLVLFNLLAFIWTFHRIVLNDYNGFSPQNMVADVNATSGPEGITDEMADTLRSLDIWAMFLDSTGGRLWSVELPADIPCRTWLRLQKAISAITLSLSGAGKTAFWYSVIRKEAISRLPGITIQWIL